MKHEMRLNNEPFKLIKNKVKTVELRLNDEKRRLVNVGDIIEFENRVTLEKLSTKVVSLHKYESFNELFKHFDKVALGYGKDEEINSEDMEKYYSKEEEKMYGVLAIEIELI